MHRAPALIFSVKRSRWHARFVLCMTLLGLASLSALFAEQSLLDLRFFAVALTVLVTSGIAFLGWKQSPQGTLRWDGQYWYWSNFKNNPVCVLRLSMDFQRIVLVSVRADDYAPVFLWLETQPNDANWKPLRRALVSSQDAVAESAGKKNGMLVDGDRA